MTTDKYLNYEGAAILAAQIKKWGCEFIRGTNTTSTNALTGVTTQESLYDGMAIDYYLPVAENGSNATLELTLPSGSTTGAIPVFIKGTSRLTSHYPQHSIIRMVYNQNRNEWQCMPDYWTTSANNFYSNGDNLKTKTVLYRYIYCLSYDESHVLPVTTADNVTATTKTFTTESFNPFGPIYYYNSSTTVNAEARVPSQRLYYSLTHDLRYSFNTGSTLVAGKAVYIVATPQSDGRAKLYSNPITQTLPTSADGLIYIHLGYAYTTTNIYLEPHHSVYEYKNGGIQLYTRDAATVNGHTVNKDVPSDAVFTDTTNNNYSQIVAGGSTIGPNSPTDTLSISAGTGAVVSGSTDAITIKAKLKSETAASSDAAAFGSTANRYYAVGVDKSGNLAVNVPWTDNDHNDNTVTTVAGEDPIEVTDAGTGGNHAYTVKHKTSGVTAGSYNGAHNMAQVGNLITVPKITVDAKGHVTSASSVNFFPKGLVYPVIGTQTYASNHTSETNWTGNINIPALYDGLTIAYYLPMAGSGSATLNLTLSDGSTTGQIPVFYKNNDRATTHYGAGSTIFLTYWSAGSISINGTLTTSASWRRCDFYTTEATNLRTTSNGQKAKTVLYRYQVCLTADADYLLPINTVDNDTGTSKTLTTEEFDPYGPIYWYNSSTTGTINMYIPGGRLFTHVNFDLRYSFNTGSTLTAYKNVYIVAKLQPNGKAKLHSSPIAQDLPTTEDGLIYILLGYAYNTTNVTLIQNHPVYQFKNNKLQPVSYGDDIFSDAISGDIVTFENCKEGLPLHDVIIELEPHQDLHGYDNPWPGGGGKNLLHNTATTQTINGVTFTVNEDGSVTVSGTATATSILILGELSVKQGESYTISGSIGAYNSQQAQIFCSSQTAFPVGNRLQSYSGISSTAIAQDDEIITVSIYVYNTVSPTGTFYPQIELGTTATDYTPYANICPITGHDTVNVWRTGKNVWDEEWELGTIDSEYGRDQNTSTSIRTKGYIPVKPGMQLYIKSPNQGSSSAGNLTGRYYDSNKQYLGHDPMMSVGSVITVPQNCFYIRFGCQANYGTTYNHDISINYPSTDHDYHPYQGTSVQLSLGQTVYGGKLNVTTGELVVTWVSSNLYDLTWVQSSPNHTIFRSVPPNMKITTTTPDRQIGFATSNYKISSNPSISDVSMDDFSALRYNGGLYIKNSDYADDVDSFKETLQNQTIYYELATPIIYHLTPQQITTLLGTNHLWSNGESITADYWQEPAIKEYVDNKRGYIYPVKGTQTAATNLWTGNIDIDALYDGLTIAYYLPYAGNSTGATLNLTLKDGTTTGPVNVYYTSTALATTHYGAGSTILLTYWSAGSTSIAGTPTTLAGWRRADYDSTNTHQQRKYYQGYYPAAALTRYQLLVTKGENQLLPMNTVDNGYNNLNKTLTTESFNPFGPIYYYNSTTAKATTDVIGEGILYDHIIMDLRYSFNTGTTLTSYKSVYIVTTLQSDGQVKLDTTTPIAQQLPSTDDGKLYIYLGQSRNTYQVEINPVHPIYQYKNGGIQLFTRDAATVNGHTVATDVPSGAVFTDTTYSEATTSAAGLMSANDKDKLDNIDMTAITKLQQILTKESNQTASLTWAVGTIAQASGNNSSNSKRIRTTDRLKCSQYTRIQVDSGYQYCVYAYSDASSGFLGSYDGTSTTTFSSTAIFHTDPMWISFNNDYYIRIVLAQIAGGTMTTDESSHIQIYGFN